MRPQEERISKLHKRAVRLQRQADWRKIQGLGSMSAFLAVLLTTVLLQAGGLSQSAPGDQFTGSSLLSEEVGGYILAAMVSRTGEQIENPRFSFLQCIQPVVFQKLAGNQELRGQGLLDRCLLCCPTTSIGKMSFFADPIPEKLRVAYDNAMYDLLRRRDSPKWLRLEPDAWKRFGEFAEDFNQRVLPTEFDGLEGAGAKHVGIVGRICGILALMENPDASTVTIDIVEKAIFLSEYYQEQIRLIHKGHLLNVEESLAEYLAGRIKACHEKGLTKIVDGEITLSFRNLSRNCNKQELKKKDDFVEPLKILQAMAWVDFDGRLSTIQINPEGIK